MKRRKSIIWSVILLASVITIFCTYQLGDKMCRAYLGKPLTMEIIAEQVAAMTEGAKLPKGKWSYGIDISHHQPIIRWSKLRILLDEDRMTVWNKKNSTTEISIDYVIMKASEGESFKDWRFKCRWRKAYEYGYKRGAYHFFRPSKAASVQANNYIKQVGYIQSADFAPILDIEVTDDLSADILNERALEWLKIIEKHYGRKPIVYANPYYLKNVLSTEITHNYPIWVANYGVSSPSWSRWHLWQFTDRALVRGVGCADLNVRPL